MRPHGKVDRFFQCAAGKSADGSDDGMTVKRKEMEPQQLFIDLALLICEGRKPELSERGRVQGPHCPQVTIQSNSPNDQQESGGAAAKSNAEWQRNKHVCDERNDLCTRARQMETEVLQLWSQNIPACLTVSLLPDECSKQENCLADSFVLEKWTIQQVEGRTREDRLLPGQFLLQAVRSYLHFSQLSAWLIASSGKRPNNILYRVCLPGESESAPSTSSSYAPADLASSVSTGGLQKHRFPLCSAGRNLCLSVTVESIPRCEKIPSTSCYCLSPSTSGTASNLEMETRGGAGDTGGNGAAIGGTGTAISTLVDTSSFSANGPQRTDQRPVVVLDEERETATEDATIKDSRDALDSRDDSGPIYDERSKSPPTRDGTGPRQRLSYVSLSLPPLVSTSSAAQYGQKQTYAVNPLFESSAPSNFSGSNNNLKDRMATLNKKTRKLSTELGMLSSATKTSKLEQHQVRKSGDTHGRASTSNVKCNRSNEGPMKSRTDPMKARFYVTDEEDEGEDDTEEGEKYKSIGERLNSYEKDQQNGNGTKRILFSDEKDFLTDDESTFSDWIDPPGNSGMGDLDTVAGDEKDDLDTVARDQKKRSSDRTENEEEMNVPVASSSGYGDYHTTTASPSKVFLPGHSRKVKRVLTFGGQDEPVRFHPKTGLPLSSSPAPLKRNHSSFSCDPCINAVTALKGALYCYEHESGGSSDSDSGWPLCKSAPASTNLLGSFEESALNGRIKPFGTVDGFTLELGASGAFCPTHVTLSVTTLFFNLSDDNAPSPYFGLCSLETVGRRGYHVPKKGSVQATLFNPQGTVVKMFVVRYDLCDMPPACQTFVRQRTFFMPSQASLRDAMQNRSWLRYLIHLRFASSSSGKLFLHTDIRMLFSRKSELEAFNCMDVGGMEMNKSTDPYELRSFTEMPKEPKFSPRKFNRTDKERVYK